MTSPLNIRALGPHIGAEVLDLDLSRGWRPELLDGIAAALLKHEALVLHVPDMSSQQQLELARHFGEPEVHTFFPNLGPGLEQITVIDSKLGDRADMWHRDEAFLPKPPIVTMTQAQILPSCGGDTCWISMSSAYDALSARMKTYLDGLSAWQDLAKPLGAALQHGAITHERYVELLQRGMRQCHPMVITHPDTGRKSIYVDPTYTSYIEGLAPSESAAVLAYLHGHCQQVHFMFRHRWQVGDMVLWDNRSVLHNAILDYQPQQRRMHRASVFARGAWRA